MDAVAWRCVSVAGRMVWPPSSPLLYMGHTQGTARHTLQAKGEKMNSTMKAPPARRGRMHGPKYSAKHDPMFTPEVLATEMQETIRLNMPRLHTMDSPDVILLTGKRLDRWLDWQSPKMQDCARAAFKAAELVTRDGWFYQPPKPAPAPRNTPVRVGGAA